MRRNVIMGLLAICFAAITSIGGENGHFNFPCHAGGNVGNPHTVGPCQLCWYDTSGAGEIDCGDVSKSDCQDYDTPGNSSNWTCQTGNCIICFPTDCDPNGCTWDHTYYKCDPAIVLPQGVIQETDTMHSRTCASVYTAGCKQN